jgi:hypothetical protein
MYYRKPQQIVLVSSVAATCFGREVHIQALTYFKNTGKAHCICVEYREPVD